MILSIVLFVLIILILALIIMFSFYVFLPSIQTEDKDIEDPIIPKNKKSFLIPEDVHFEKNGLKAFVMCNCKKETKLTRTEFNEAHSCFLAKSTYGTGTDCIHACIGLGDCVKVCPQQAIFIENKTAIISNNCCGCGKCVDICPQKLIKLIDYKTQKLVTCNNTDNLTSCNKLHCEENISWSAKKDFKIWTYCYKIIKRLYK